MTTDYESRLWLDSLLRNSDTLEKRVTDIVINVHEGNQYDSNIKELDNNIYILTELIQDDIQYYIYYQTNHMETVTNELNAQVHTFLILLSVLIAVLGAVVAIAAFTVTSGILRPLWQLYDATGEIAEGNFAVRTNAKTSDEIAVLSQGFNEMAGNMQLLVDQVRDDEQKMRKADLRLLQEQINPFLIQYARHNRLADRVQRGGSGGRYGRYLVEFLPHCTEQGKRIYQYTHGGAAYPELFADSGSALQ